MLGKLIVGCAAAVALLTLATPATASVDDLVGRWTAQDAGGEVTSIQVTRSGSGVRIQVFVRCPQQPQQACGWGEIPATPFAPSAMGNPDRDAIALMARYDASAPRRTIIMHLTSDGARYEVFTDFTDTQRRASHVETGSLRRMQIARTPPSPRARLRRTTLPGENCVAINQANLQVVNVGGQWNIMDGSRQVHHFGGDRAAAEEALEIIRFYGFTSQCVVPVISPVIANPRPTMMYWRRGDTVPAYDGSRPDQRCIPGFPGIYPPNVHTELVNGSWFVVGGQSRLLNFGTDRALAEQAVAVIRHYDLDKMCSIYSSAYIPPIDDSERLMQFWLTE